MLRNRRFHGPTDPAACLGELRLPAQPAPTTVAPQRLDAPAPPEDRQVNGVRLERAEGQPLTDATARQRRMALLACIAMLVGTALLLPFAAQTVGSVPAFFPVYQTAAIGCCLITAYLLYAHFQAVGAVPLLHLAGGYLYIAMVMVMQMASYEGMVPEGSTAMGGPQTAIWLWLAWHLAPALSVMVLVLVQGTRRTDPAGKKAAAWQTAFTVGAAGIATATLVFGFPDALPVLEVGGDYGAITRSGLAPALQVLFVAALVMLWRASRFRNVMHVWLAMTIVALFCDVVLTMAGGSRSSAGWHAARIGGLIALSVLAVVYLWEIRTSYAQSVLLADRLGTSNSRLDAEARVSQRHAQDLEQADLRKDEFIAMVAHELRNPLAPMQSAAQILSIASTDAALVKKTSAMLMRQVKQMSGLIEDLLDASCLSRGVALLEWVPLDTRQVLSESIEQVRPLLDERAHTLTVDMPDKQLLVAGDHRRLVQVFTNLLVNSAKYTPPGGSQNVHADAAGQEIRIRVKDNGIGMSPELSKRAFTLFSQGAPSSHKPHAGLGVGLALVKTLVELHQGTVHAASAGEGLGTEMLVRLPIVQATA